MSVCTCVLPFCDSWSMKVYSLFQSDINVEPERNQMEIGEKMTTPGFPKTLSAKGLPCHNLHNYLRVRARANVPVCIFVYSCVCIECLYSLQQKKKRWCTSTDFRTFSLAPSTGIEVLLGTTRNDNMYQYGGSGRHRPPLAALMHNCTRPMG